MDPRSAASFFGYGRDFTHGCVLVLKAPPISKTRLCLCAVTIKTSQGRITERGQTRVFQRVAGFRSSSSCASRRLGLRSGWDFADLEARLMAYAKEKKPSEWIKAQPAFLGAQGKTIFDPDFDIDDDGLPHEKPVIPGL